MDFRLKTPCANCPFRTDIPAYLRPERAMEIVQSLLVYDEPFPCHKTVECGPEGEIVRRFDTESHCAGALLLCEAIRRPNQMMRIAERLGVYDPRALDYEASVVRTALEFVERCREKVP